MKKVKKSRGTLSVNCLKRDITLSVCGLIAGIVCVLYLLSDDVSANCNNNYKSVVNDITKVVCTNSIDFEIGEIISNSRSTERQNEIAEAARLYEDSLVVSKTITTWSPINGSVMLTNNDILTIVDIAKQFNLDPAMILGQIFVESRGTVDAVGDGGCSFGLMQIQPKWWTSIMDQYGISQEELLTVEGNVTVGCAIMKYLTTTYNYHDALTVYNTGSRLKENGYSTKVENAAKKFRI